MVHPLLWLAEHSSAYRWYRKRRDFFAVAGFFVVCGVGFIVVEDTADKAQDAADRAERLAMKTRVVARENRRLAEANSELGCALGELISGQPVLPRLGETRFQFTLRVILLREFAESLRALDRLLERFELNVEGECKAERPAHIRLRPADRAFLLPEILERSRGGDDLGTNPGGGGGRPGGDSPPATR